MFIFNSILCASLPFASSGTAVGKSSKKPREKSAARVSQQREGPGWDLLHFMHAQHPFFPPNSADQEFARAALSPPQQDGAQKSFPQESLGSSTFPPSVGLFCSHIPIKALHSIILSRSQLWLYAGTALFGLFFFFSWIFAKLLKI